jgi:1-acyl-sn-glycerol-3-phosphate acyltransferase
METYPEPLVYSNDVYRTSQVRVSLMSRLLPSMMFYLRVSSVVFRASSKAKRGRHGRKEWLESSQGVMEAIEGAGISIEVSGVSNVRGLDGPCVFVANHMSTLETFFLPAILLPIMDITFVIKKSLVEYPVFKHIMRARDPVILSRTDPREDLKTILGEGTARLKSGKSVVVFPQTTRSTVFDCNRFNSIGIKLARKAGTPVVPIAIRSDAWGNGKYLRDYGRIDPAKKVYFSFGEPMRIEGRGGEEHEKALDFIGSRMKMWGISVIEKNVNN